MMQSFGHPLSLPVISQYVYLFVTRFIYNIVNFSGSLTWRYRRAALHLVLDKLSVVHVAINIHYMVQTEHCSFKKKILLVGDPLRDTCIVQLYENDGFKLKK